MGKKVTIYTLAEELDLTPSAVSRAFNPNTRLAPEKRMKILEAADRYGFRPNRFASRLPMETVRIGVLIYGGFAPFYTKVEEGIRKAYARLADYKIECDVRVLPRSEYSTADCGEVLREFVQREYGGAIVCGLYDPEVLKIVSDSPTRLACVHYPLSRDLCLFSSTHSFELAGMMAADMLHVCRRKRILLLTGDPNSAVHSRVRDSFLSAAQKYGMEIPEICESVETDREWPRKAEAYFRERKGDFDGVYVTTGRCLDVCAALRQQYSPGEITLIATDLYPEMKEYLDDGTISACIFQNQNAQAEKAFETLAHHLIENTPRPDDIALTPLLVTKSNQEMYL